MFARLLEFLFSLNHVRIGSGTHFAFVWDYPALIILGALLLAALGYLSYIPQTATPGKKVAMGLVRALLVALIFILIWRPQLVMEHEDRTRSVVAVWLDSSLSMTLQDPYTGPGVEQAMRDFVKQASAGNAATRSARLRIDRYDLGARTLAGAHWLGEVTDAQDIAFFTGSAHAQLLGVAHNPAEVAALTRQLADRKPTGESTDVPTVIQDILQSVSGQRISAIVLLTDGQTNEPGSRLDLAADDALHADARIFPLPLGQADEPFNLKLTSSIQMPEQTFVKDPITARLHVAGSGITHPVPVRISIFRQPPTAPGAATGPDLGAPLATREITLDPSKKETDVDLALRLQKQKDQKFERFDLIARVDPVNPGPDTEELTTADNTATGHTTVVDAQMNVLYVEGYPRWEFRYLKNELIREPTINVSTFLLSADEGFVQDADPPVHDKNGRELFPGPITRFPETAQELAKYDVLLIGDVDPTFFSPTQQRLIVDFVYGRGGNGGGGIGWIAGPAYNPEAYRDTPLGVLLPVIPDELDPRARILPPAPNRPFNLVLTPAGKDTNLFRFFDDPEVNARQVADLSAMYWYKPIQGLMPQATVLAVHPDATLAGKPMPLLVAGQYGEGRTLFCGYCDTWRWRYYTGEPLFQSYWLQLCRYLYANKVLGQSKRVELIPESTTVEIGKPIRLHLIIRDPTLANSIPAEIPVSILDKDGRSVQTIILTRAPGARPTTAPNTETPPESLQATATASQLGDFTLSIQNGLLPVDISPIEFHVAPPREEFAKTTTDLVSLGTLARKTTGELLPPYRSEELAKLIPDRSIPVLVSQSEELWNKPIALVLVVLIASIEWMIRKSAGLI